MVDSHHSIELGNDALANLSCPAKSGEIDCKPLTCVPTSSEKSLQRDGQQGDKDVESYLTQDASSENMLDEYPGVSSCVVSKTFVKTVTDRHSLDPESSPDSDVYNPVVDVVVSPVEAGSLTIQYSGLTQSTTLPEMTVLGHAKFSHYSEAIISPESASSLNLLQL